MPATPSPTWSCRARSISATASRCAARCRRRARAWSGRSSSSTISGRRNSAPATASTCGRIRISGLPPSPICSTARSCTATASAPRSPIKPGEVNWMTAGRGIVHSERTGAEHCARPASPIHGLQMWVALPAAKEEMDAGLRASRRSTNFRWSRDNGKTCASWSARSTAQRSPVPTVHETHVRRCARSTAGATLPLDAGHEERAIYVVDGDDRHRRRQVRAPAGCWCSSPATASP